MQAAAATVRSVCFAEKWGEGIKSISRACYARTNFTPLLPGQSQQAPKSRAKVSRRRNSV